MTRLLLWGASLATCLRGLIDDRFLDLDDASLDDSDVAHNHLAVDLTVAGVLDSDDLSD